MYTFMGLDEGERDIFKEALTVLSTHRALNDEDRATLGTLRDYLDHPTEAFLVAVMQNGSPSFYCSCPDLARLPITITDADRTYVFESRAVDDPDRLEKIYAELREIKARKQLEDTVAAVVAWAGEVKSRDVRGTTYAECRGLLDRFADIVRPLLGEVYAPQAGLA